MWPRSGPIVVQIWQTGANHPFAIFQHGMLADEGVWYNFVLCVT